MVRALAILAGGVVLLTIAGGALASHASSARAEPTALYPGQELALVFEVAAPDVAEIVVQERVECTLAFPDGTERSPCSRPGSTLELRTSGDEARTYVVPYQAPDQEGRYAVTFETNSTARAPSHARAAETSFQVISTDDPLPSAEGDDPNAQPPTDPEADPPGEPPGEDGEQAQGGGSESADDGTLASLGGGEARLTTSLTVATAVIAGAAVFARTEPG